MVTYMTFLSKHIYWTFLYKHHQNPTDRLWKNIYIRMLYVEHSKKIYRAIHSDSNDCARIGDIMDVIDAFTKCIVIF